MSRWSEQSTREKVRFIACVVLGSVVGRFVAQWSLPLGVAVAVAIGGVVLARRAPGAQGFWVAANLRPAFAAAFSTSR